MYVYYLDLSNRSVASRLSQGRNSVGHGISRASVAQQKPRRVRELGSQGCFQNSERKMAGWIHRAHWESIRVTGMDRPGNDTTQFMFYGSGGTTNMSRDSCKERRRASKKPQWDWRQVKELRKTWTGSYGSDVEELKICDKSETRLR